jgi:hypothetical protein
LHGHVKKKNITLKYFIKLESFILAHMEAFNWAILDEGSRKGFPEKVFKLLPPPGLVQMVALDWATLNKCPRKERRALVLRG